MRDWIGERMNWLLGAIGLIAWVALLWAMFGDVL